MGYQVLALNDNEEIMVDLRKHVLALAQSFIAFVAFSGLVIFFFTQLRIGGGSCSFGFGLR